METSPGEKLKRQLSFFFVSTKVEDVVSPAEHIPAAPSPFVQFLANSHNSAQNFSRSRSYFFAALSIPYFSMVRSAFVEMRSVTKRFPSGQKMRRFWRFTPWTFLLRLWEKVTTIACRLGDFPVRSQFLARIIRDPLVELIRGAATFKSALPPANDDEGEYAKTEPKRAKKTSGVNCLHIFLGVFKVKVKMGARLRRRLIGRQRSKATSTESKPKIGPGIFAGRFAAKYLV